MTDAPEAFPSFHDRVVGSAVAREYLDAPITERERDDIVALIEWFRRRYPTPAERLAYVRRAYARWQRTLGMAGPARYGHRTRRVP